MAGDKVITLRFQERKAIDMELYRRLEEGKGKLGMSMPAYVKGVLRECLGDTDGAGLDAGADAYMERIREIVHGELASQSSALVGTLEKIAEGFTEGVKRTGQTGGLPESLPGYSDSLPEGFDGVLEKFM